MPTLITQDEFETEVLLNPNLTMAIPAFATLPVAQIPKKRWIQQDLWNREVALPSPETKTIQVQGHNCGTTQVHSHLHNINESMPRPMETRKRPRPPNPRRRLENKKNCLSQWAR
jgi:hypothetical protein